MLNECSIEEDMFRIYESRYDFFGDIVAGVKNGFVLIMFISRDCVHIANSFRYLFKLMSG